MKDSFDKRTDVNELGEFGLIKHLSAQFELKNQSSILGIGDDAAVISNVGFETVVSTDMLVDGIHFDLMYMPLKHLGYKSIIVNLSDIYAMNATPKQVLVSIAISNRFSVEALDELYAGIKMACDYYKVDLIGGDTTSSPKGLTISVTAIGQGEKDKICKRSGAKPGDIICVSGDLGAAYLGLQILEREKQIYLSNPGIQPDLEGQDYLIGRQLKPEAKWNIIDQLSKSNIVPTAMIDISDGLASEMMHICEASDVGGFIEEGHIPMHDDVTEMALKFKINPITTALNGGEDYELLFTIDPKDLPKARLLNDIYMIGEITAKSEGVTLHTTGGNIHPLEAQGFKHFEDSNQN